MRFDVNETLLRHLATGAGAASELRADAAPELAPLVAALFDARSDLRRLNIAQQVARTILQVNDFGDIMELRDIVAQQELRRLINYSKQKDHTVHTVYLYLLGLWFFDSVTAIHDAVRKRSGTEGEQELCGWFLFQWVFASLLHDIGYAFYDLSEDTQEDRKRIDDIYSYKWIERLFGENPTSGRRLSSETLQQLAKAHAKWVQRYSKKMGPATNKLTPDAQVEVLERLASAPWLGDLNADWKRSDIFSILALDSDDDLRPYAMTVAKKGYSREGRIGFVDHAVASGLLLFQYTSYWYWLLNELGTDTEAYKEAAGGYDYNPNNLTQAVDACRAVAYHNVQASVEGGAKILSKITLEHHPILYLSIICDELQSWDRPPSGDAVLRQFQDTAATSLEGEDIEIRCAGTDNKIATFRVGHPQKTAILKALRDTLQRRVSGFEQVIELLE